MANTAVQYYYDVIQTFYIDPLSVSGATKVELTSIDLYVKSKPVSAKQTGGIQLWLCNVVNNQPDPTSVIPNSQTYLPYDAISALGDASQPSEFQFSSLVQVNTGAFYGIVVSYADVTSSYDLWVNKTGDGVLGQNILSPGPSTVHNMGSYYKGTHTAFVSGSTNLTPISGTTLKFNVNFAQYTTNSINVNVVNKEYEFFNVTRSNTSSFIPGELVFQLSANASATATIVSGNATITCTSNTFNSAYVGKYVALWNGSTVPAQFDLFQVSAVTNGTNMTVSTLPGFSNSSANFFFPVTGRHNYSSYIDGFISLVDSTAANASFCFGSGNTIIGNDSQVNAVITSVTNIPINRVTPQFAIGVEPNDYVITSYSYAYGNTGSGYAMSGYNTFTSGTDLPIGVNNAVIMSRSNEVVQSNLYGTNKKSSTANVTITVNSSVSAGLYHSPAINYNELDIEAFVYSVSNTYTASGTVVAGNTTYTVTNDTEVAPAGGIALSKYLCTTVTFACNHFAEDALCYLTAYRPQGTQINLYCKLHNSNDPDSFDSKSWTPMTITNNGTKYSSSANTNDLVEYTYGIPTVGPSVTTVSGTFTTTLSSANITGSVANAQTLVSVGNLIKIYNPLQPTLVYQVGVVTAANGTNGVITLGEPISNSSMVGSGFAVDVLQYNNIAYHNVLNSNVVSYFNSNMARFDTFDQMQLKIVLLADNPNLSPQCDQYQFIGVSA